MKKESAVWSFNTIGEMKKSASLQVVVHSQIPGFLQQQFKEIHFISSSHHFRDILMHPSSYFTSIWGHSVFLRQKNLTDGFKLDQNTLLLWVFRYSGVNSIRSLPCYLTQFQPSCSWTDGLTFVNTLANRAASGRLSDCMSPGPAPPLKLHASSHTFSAFIVKRCNI